MTGRILLIATIVALLAGTALADNKHPLDRWSGLVKVDAVKQLPNPLKTKAKGSVFTSTVITDNMTLAKFVDAAGKAFPQDAQAKLNFEKFALIVVVLEENTNKIKSGISSLGEDGTATVDVDWVPIEPLYSGRFPATCHFIPKKDLEAVNIKLTDGTSLGKVVVYGSRFRSPCQRGRSRNSSTAQTKIQRTESKRTTLGTRASRTH